MKKTVNSEADVRISNEIAKIYMSDAQYERVAEMEANPSRELSEDEYYRLKRKLY